jgi:F-type H+-transporting ATPase subunit b
MNNPLVQPDPGLFIWTILTFLVLLTLLAKFAWGPLLQALEGRQKMIEKALEDAALAKTELERLHQESAQIIAKARQEADAIIIRSRSDAEALREELRQKARGEADGIIRNAERQIQSETARALQQIRHEAVDISVAIASKIIQRNLSLNPALDQGRAEQATCSAAPASADPFTRRLPSGPQPSRRSIPTSLRHPKPPHSRSRNSDADAHVARPGVRGDQVVDHHLGREAVGEAVEGDSQRRARVDGDVLATRLIGELAQEIRWRQIRRRSCNRPKRNDMNRRAAVEDRCQAVRWRWLGGIDRARRDDDHDREWRLDCRDQLGGPGDGRERRQAIR